MTTSFTDMPMVNKNVILMEQLNISRPRLEDYLRATGWKRSLKLENGWRNRCVDGEPFLFVQLQNFPKVILTVTTGLFQHVFEYDCGGNWRVLAQDLSFWEARTGQSTWVN